ncbi:MAG: ATP-dependent DNA helicase [Pseudomonadota bacterium]
MRTEKMLSVLEPGGIIAQKLANYEFRPEQTRMSEAVRDALKDNKYLILEAETGIGKTLAYLIPAILSGRKIIISTGTKNLQEQIYFKDIPLLKEILPMDFTVIYMKGRNNYLCPRRFRQFSSQLTLAFDGDLSHLGEINEWAKTTETGDRSELYDVPDDYPLWNDICSKSDLCFGQKCESFDTCFITRMRQRAAVADIIIVNHHLFFADLGVKGTGFGEIIPRYDAVIFDEAHQLEEVATNYFGITVSNYRLEELARDIQKNLRLAKIDNKEINQALDSLRGRQERFFGSLENVPLRYRLRENIFHNNTLTHFGDILNSLELISTRLNTLEYKSEELRACSKRASDIKEQLAFIINMQSPLYVYWSEKRGKGVFFHASPIDISCELNTRLFSKVKSIIFTSATISINKSFSYFKNRLGLEGEIDELSLSSHFNYARQTMLYLPRGIPDPNSSRFAGSISEEIEKILSVTSGRAFVLFTSYKNMTEVYQRLRDRLGFSVLLQGMKPKSYLLAEFKRDVNSVLFATHSFWEGVDVQGEALSCVIIDKLPFASPAEPVVEARIDNILRSGGNPFLDYQLPSAIITLRQGIGRLIRNKNDRGVLSILDNRILTREYGEIFINSLPNCPITNNLADVENFFN